jgi:threonine dehydrogenase-like Zn-dependent dehydrogenase
MLVRTEVGWSVREFERPDDERKSLSVVAILIPPGAQHGALCVATDAQHGKLCIGWGPPAEVLPTDSSPLLPVQQDASPSTALLLPTVAITQALDDAGTTGLAGVLGNGLLGALTTRLLGFRDVTVAHLASDGRLDMVVDTTGSVDRWEPALASLRPEGTFLTILPPDTTETHFDFYPHVHRRSLQIFARYWHQPPRALDASRIETLHRLISDLLAEHSGLVTPLELTSASSRGDTWEWFDWQS